MTQRRTLKQRVRWVRRQPRYVQAESAVLGLLIWCLLWVVRWTTRYECIGQEVLDEYWGSGKRVVFAFWHGRSIMLPFLARGRDIVIMNSTHRDGEIITRALVRFGIRTKRGSASSNAVAGTLGLLRELRGGTAVALIPDGPRGPAGEAKAGASELAVIGDAALVPISFSASRAKRASGWDRMMFPMPGARVVCMVGDPIHTGNSGKLGRSRDGDDKDNDKREERERLRLRLEESLHELSRAADRAAGREEEAC